MLDCRGTWPNRDRQVAEARQEHGGAFLEWIHDRKPRSPSSIQRQAGEAADSEGEGDDQDRRCQVPGHRVHAEEGFEIYVLTQHHTDIQRTRHASEQHTTARPLKERAVMTAYARDSVHSGPKRTMCSVPEGFTVPVQCPYSARTVPVQCPYTVPNTNPRGF